MARYNIGSFETKPVWFGKHLMNRWGIISGPESIGWGWFGEGWSRYVIVCSLGLNQTFLVLWNSLSRRLSVIGTWFWALVYLLYWTAFFPSTTTNPVQILLKFDIIFWLNIWRETKWLWCTCSFGGQHYSLQVQQFEFQSCWSLTLYSGLNLGSNNYL